MAATPLLIGVDWGTTSCRAYLIGADGVVLSRASGGPGILAVEDGDFAGTLRDMIVEWLQDYDKLPIVLSGMIGSRQGWYEVPYVRAPARIYDLALGLYRIEDEDFGNMSFVPGLTIVQDDMPDVMRGEETQVIGAMAALGIENGLFVLPGTHSKWVEVSEGRIGAFRTFMTGEVYAALKDHSILGRLMRETVPDGAGFSRGVATGIALPNGGALLNRIFGARTYGLFDRMPATALADYLSGMLIGAEITEATRTMQTHGRPIVIVGSTALNARYSVALRQTDRASAIASPDASALGHFRIAKMAGIVT